MLFPLLLASCCSLLAYLPQSLSYELKIDDILPPNAVIWNITAFQNHKKNKKNIILQAVSGAARKGKLHAIVGPSGSGKSTLLNTLAQVGQL